VTVSPDPRYDRVNVSSSGTSWITPAGVAAIASYAGTYYTAAVFPASNTDARLPMLEITTSSVVMNVLPGDGATVQAEIASLLVGSNVS
jgi:hypothetical protein